MASRIGSAYVDVSANRKPLKKDLDKARKDVKNATGRMQKNIDKINWRVVGASALAAAVVVGIAMKKCIDAASALQEVQNKFDVVFAGQQDKAEAWSKTLVESYMMSTRESKQYLSSVQDLLVPMGMAASAAGEMSNEVVKLSADLGSFNDLPTGDVMRDIQSALVGEYQTMRKYGVVLSATIVQQEALNMGLADTVKELTAADKAQAAFKLITEGSTAAIGDSARSADSYANIQKKLGSAVEDLAANIGRDLLPMISDLSSALVIAINWMNKLFGERSTEDQITQLTKLRDEVIKYGANEIEAADIIVSASKRRTEEIINGYNLEIMALQEQQKLKKDLEDKERQRKEEAVDNAKQVAQDAEAEKIETEKKKEALEERLELVKEFNEMYDESQLDKYELETKRVDEMIEKYREAGADEVKLTQLKNKKLATIEAKKVAEELKARQKYNAAKLELESALQDNLLNLAASMAKEGSAIGKAIFMFQQIKAIKESIMLTGVAVMQAAASTPPPANIPLIASAKALGALNTGIIAAQAITGFARGGIFDEERYEQFAKGGIVSKPTLFNRNLGLLGEAGPEVIMPLSRTKSGKLGVAVAESGGSQPQIIIDAPLISIGGSLIADDDTFQDFVEEIFERMEELKKLGY